VGLAIAHFSTKLHRDMGVTRVGVVSDYKPKACTVLKWMECDLYRNLQGRLSEWSQYEEVRRKRRDWEWRLMNQMMKGEK
jgi:hypothetical protein